MRLRSSVVVVATLAVLIAPAAPVAAQTATPTCAGVPATIVGTNGDDILRGTAKADVIVGNGGNDTIYGAKGNDIICANAGDDYIQGGPGRDLIIGGYGDDRIIGNAGNDDLRGGFGDDYISGKEGADRIRGDQGVDRIAGNLGVDTCTVQNIDTQITSCEEGNSRTKAGIGDAVVTPEIPDTFRVVRHCFSAGRCDDYYVARVSIDGSGTYDAMSVQAFNADGDPIATYGGVGDTFSGAFMFKDKPEKIEVDSGGGLWSITFVNRYGLPLKRAATKGSGNEVYRVSNTVKTFGQVTTTWNGYGNFAVVGVSPGEGRDLMVNEVRFSRGESPPFTTEATAKSGISVVQVLSSADAWTVHLAK